MSEPFLGQITMVAFDFAPRGWAFCDGQLLSIAQNTALFSLFGTTYGGDGRTSFGLPDLRGRVAIHRSNNYSQGAKGGVESVTLQASQLPAHNHALEAQPNQGTATPPSSNMVPAAGPPVLKVWSNASPDNSMNGATISMTGGGQSHTNMQPFAAVRFIVALVGVYPSRN